MSKTKRKASRKPAKRKKSSAAKRRPVRRKASAKRKPVKRKKRRAPKRRLVKQVERSSVERVLTGRRKTRSRKRGIVMAGSRPRRRSVGDGGGGGSKMLLGLAIGAAAIYFLTKKTTTATNPNLYPQLPPVTQTSNITRNTQSQDLVNYAMAGGLAIDAIVRLIEKLNTSSDNEVQNIYDVVNTTGSLEYYV